MMFCSYDEKSVGPLHRQKVNIPYPSKDHLQQKRYIAQSMDTTYIYDFVEMFKQVLYIHVCSQCAALTLHSIYLYRYMYMHYLTNCIWNFCNQDTEIADTTCTFVASCLVKWLLMLYMYIYVYLLNEDIIKWAFSCLPDGVCNTKAPLCYIMVQ